MSERRPGGVLEPHTTDCWRLEAVGGSWRREGEGGGKVFATRHTPLNAPVDPEI